MSYSIKISVKDIIWNYLGYAFSLGVNIFLLPAILYYLPSEELGLWYVFLSIASFITMLDFGFSPQIARTISYIYAGATQINKTGVSPITRTSSINIVLMKHTISAAKGIYFIISCVSLLILTGASQYIYAISNGLSFSHVISAWFIFSVGCFINILYNYYNAIYRGLGYFSSLNKALVLSKSSQIIITFILLYNGLGIVSVSISYLLSGLLFRSFLFLHFKYKTAIGKKMKMLKAVRSTYKNKYESFKIIWHNSWKDGIVMTSRYLTTQSNTILCSLYLGLSNTAGYALSIQLLTIVASFSSIYLSTKYPVMNEACSKNDKYLKYKIFSESWVIFLLSFILAIILIVTIGFPVIELIKPNILVNIPLFLFMTLYLFLETNHSIFASYISTSNRIPYWKGYLISSIGGVILALILITQTPLGIWGLILAHFFVQLLYNNWKWPVFVLKEENVNIINFLKLGFSQLLKIFIKWKT
jgi:O-antigen/teichoic acid export membrane protein